MTVSFTYNQTKLIAERLIAITQVCEVWLQAKQLQADGKTAIVVADGNEYIELNFEKSGILIYFRDLREMTVEDAETDACNAEFWLTQPVRMVCVSQQSNYNGNELSKLILQCLLGYEVTGIYFDQFQIINEELPDSNIMPSVGSFIFAVEFNVKSLLQIQDCVFDVSCSIENLKICAPI